MIAWAILGAFLALAAMLGLAWLRHRGRVAAAGAARGSAVAASDADIVAAVAGAAPHAAVQYKAPVARPDGSGGALTRALGAASLALWRRAFGIEAGALVVPEDHEFAAQALERALQVDAIGERYFPRRPMLMPQLQAAANDPDAPPTRLAEIIQQDPVLTGDVLRLANSVYYRVTTEPVESLQRAIITCGTDGLQRLAATALVQPVFRSNSQGQHRFAQLLWERCTRSAVAAEACARQWCPQDRQAVHLLPLLSALGPLVAYRMVDDAYRAASRRPSPEASLALVLRHGPRIAARVAAQWQVPPRLVQALAGETPEDPDEAAALATMLRAWQAGELLATLGLLAEEGVLGQRVFAQQAAQAGLPEAIVEHAWERLQVARDDTAPAAARG